MVRERKGKIAVAAWEIHKRWWDNVMNFRITVVNRARFQG